MKNVFAVSIIAREAKAPRVTYQKVVYVDAPNAREAKEICRNSAAEQGVTIIKISAKRVF